MATTFPSSQLNEFRPGTQFQQYRLLEQIGVGGQGVVWSAFDRKRESVVAIKFDEAYLSEQKQIDDKMLEREAGRLLKLRHPRLLPLIDFGLAGTTRYMVSPYITGGSLAGLIQSKQLSLDLILRLTVEIASALDYLHGQQIVHRDLKPGNVLIDLHRHAYVADFGLARTISTSTRAMHTGRGTPPYSPPEQHTMAQMTPGSDIFNFGVMLYELFTLQLPWDGQIILGLEQLRSDAELPDPREINSNLPRPLVNVLRQMTAADPAVRLRTAGEALQMILDCFGFSAPPDPSGQAQDPDTLRQDDSLELLERSRTKWSQAEDRTILTLTKFAIVDLEQARLGRDSASAEDQRMMLHHALTFGYNDEAWWQAAQPAERLKVASALIHFDNEDVRARIVGQLLKDPELRSRKDPLPDEMGAALLHLAEKTDNPWLRQESLHVLLALFPAAKNWRKFAFDPEQDQALAEMALTEGADGAAVQLIGRTRSLTATQKFLAEADAEKQARGLRMIQQSAGSLPASIPFRTRLGVSIQWLVRRLTARPPALLAGYGLAFLGSALGFGSVAYLSYRLPAYLDQVRISISLERGIYLGIPFGLGIFLTRLIVERFPRANPFLRLFFAILTGGGILNLTMIAYNAIILNTPSNGILLTAACLWVAAGFAMGALIQNRFGKTVISILISFLAVAGSWMVHATLASSPLDMTPLVIFEYTLSIPSIQGMAFLTVLPMAVLGNLVKLSIRE